MKKILAIFLTVLMVLTIVPMAAFARVDNGDKIITEILNNNSFNHIKFVDDKDSFKGELITYKIGHVSTWLGSISGEEDANYAKEVLLAMIERAEPDLQNETFEKIIKALEGAKTAADILEKIDGVTGVLDLANNAQWAESIGVLGNVIKVMNLGNEAYEDVMEGLAQIVSCQMAGVYFANLLQYLIDCPDLDQSIKTAAAELKNNIDIPTEEKVAQLVDSFAQKLANEGVQAGVALAMNTNTVTAAIYNGYNIVTSVADKVLKTNEAYDYLMSLVKIRQIEEVLPAYVTAKLAGDDQLDADFAIGALLTMRENGELMLCNTKNLYDQGVINLIFKSQKEAANEAKDAAKDAAKIVVYRDIILKDITDKEGNVVVPTTYLVEVSDKQSVGATVRNANGVAIGNIRSNGVQTILNEKGAFYSVHNETLNKDIKVVVAFIDGCQVSYGSSSGSTTTGGSGFSFGSIFASLFASLSSLFSGLFSIFSF